MLAAERKKTAVDMEMNMIEKELKAHSMNQEISPPVFPAVTANRDFKPNAMRVFPTRNPKFSGVKSDKEGGNTMSVLEFLTIMNSAQESCKLSEKDFLDMMLICTTGKAHSLITDWMSTGENVQNIYHLLLLNYDKRITPTEARAQLSSYKASKNENLATVEAHILQLSNRANSVLPMGIARVCSHNMDSVTALIRALPPVSAALASNNYHQLSARLGRAATYVELTRKLHLFKDTIDKEIKTSGGDARKSIKPMGNTTGGFRPFKKKQASTSSLQTTTPTVDYTEGKTDKHKGKEGDKGAIPKKRGKQGGWKKPNNEQKGIEGCSLCGKHDHRAAEGCPNMVSDRGNIVPVIPAQNTCTACPPFVKPRLHHNVAICPYRRGGVFNPTA
jgi:hypothetical protein